MAQRSIGTIHNTGQAAAMDNGNTNTGDTQMIPVMVTIGDGLDARMLADVDCVPSFPYGTSRSEKQEFYDGCEVHLYKEKSGNRATKVESVIPERIWKSIRRQMKEAAA